MEGGLTQLAERATLNGDVVEFAEPFCLLVLLFGESGGEEDAFFAKKSFSIFRVIAFTLFGSTTGEDDVLAGDGGVGFCSAEEESADAFSSFCDFSVLSKHFTAVLFSSDSSCRSLSLLFWSFFLCLL